MQGPEAQPWRSHQLRALHSDACPWWGVAHTATALVLHASPWSLPANRRTGQQPPTILCLWLPNIPVFLFFLFNHPFTIKMHLFFTPGVLNASRLHVTCLLTHRGGGNRGRRVEGIQSIPSRELGPLRTKLWKTHSGGLKLGFGPSVGETSMPLASVSIIKRSRVHLESLSHVHSYMWMRVKRKRPDLLCTEKIELAFWFLVGELLLALTANSMVFLLYLCANNIKPQVGKIKVRFTCLDSTDVSEDKCLLYCLVGREVWPRRPVSIRKQKCWLSSDPSWLVYGNSNTFLFGTKINSEELMPRLYQIMGILSFIFLIFAFAARRLRTKCETIVTLIYPGFLVKLFLFLLCFS